MNIGPHELANNVFAAPMAGVTDRPFRMLCRALGAGYAVSEMVTSRRDLWTTLAQKGGDGKAFDGLAEQMRAVLTEFAKAFNPQAK